MYQLLMIQNDYIVIAILIFLVDDFQILTFFRNNIFKENELRDELYSNSSIKFQVNLPLVEFLKLNSNKGFKAPRFMFKKIFIEFVLTLS